MTSRLVMVAIIAVLSGTATSLLLQSCSASQDRAALVRDAIKTASDVCTAYEHGTKHDEKTDQLCLALMLAQRAVETPVIGAAGAR